MRDIRIVVAGGAGGLERGRGEFLGGWEFLYFDLSGDYMRINLLSGYLRFVYCMGDIF